MTPGRTEAERLRVVASLRLLDTPREERFDRITRTASALFGVPVALVSLLDAERLFVKSCVGGLPSEVPRSSTVCRVTVGQDAALVVPDLAQDPRFADLDVVREGLRSYAGVPLRVRGTPVGTLCLFATEPRPFGPEELERLHDLGAWAEGELDRTDLAEALEQQAAAQAALSVLQQRLEVLLDAAETAVVGTDATGAVTLVNPAAARLLALGPSAVGRDLHDVAHGGLHPHEQCPLHRALRERRPQRVAADTVPLPGGGTRDVEWTAAPTVVDGEVTGAVVTLSDISTRRAVERMKDEFVSVVSHELRTPLTSIRGSLGLLGSGRFGELPDPAARLVQIAVGNTDRLVRLVNDILDLERIESGKVEVDLRRQRLQPLLEQARDAVDGSAADVPVVLSGEDLEAAVDADLLVQALTNLLANAVKFSSPGSPVEVVCERVDGEVHVRVRDHGRGIPADRLTRVFERFEQVDASDAREKGGTGLGLAITRSIAAALGGRVLVASELGVGSTFTLVLPDSTAQDPEGRCWVVVVEDDVDLSEVLSAGLAQQGLDVAVARTQAEAVDLVRRLRPLLLVLDVELAVGDGYGVAAALRQDPATAGTRVLVATVHDLDEATRSRLQVGPTGFVRKGRGEEDVVQVVLDTARELCDVQG